MARGDGARRLAVHAHDGLARAILPAHTIGDGDVAFAIATGGPLAGGDGEGHVAVPDGVRGQDGAGEAVVGVDGEPPRAIVADGARRLAVHAHDGLARAILPAHTIGDGDVAFAIATGERPAGGDGEGHVAVPDGVRGQDGAGEAVVGVDGEPPRAIGHGSPSTPTTASPAPSCPRTPSGTATWPSPSPPAPSL